MALMEVVLSMHAMCHMVPVKRASCQFWHAGLTMMQTRAAQEESEDTYELGSTINVAWLDIQICTPGTQSLKAQSNTCAAIGSVPSSPNHPVMMTAVPRCNKQNTSAIAPACTILYKAADRLLLTICVSLHGITLQRLLMDCASMTFSCPHHLLVTSLELPMPACILSHTSANKALTLRRPSSES